MNEANSDATLLGLMDSLYAGIAEPEGLGRFAQSLRTTLGAAYAGFVIRTKNGQQVVSDGGESSFFRDYRAHFHAADPFCDAVLRLQPGQCSDTRDLIAASQVRRTEFYCDFLRPHRLESSLAGVIGHLGGRANVVSAFFDHARGPTGKACDLVTRLLPHIRRVNSVRAQLLHPDEPHTLSEQLIEQFSCAAFAVRRNGRLLLVNSVGRALLTARDGLLVDGPQLRASASADRRTLERELYDAGIPGHPGAGVIRLERPSGRVPLIALVSPLAAGDMGERDVLVLARDPEAVSTPNPEAIAQALGLTLAEARVAAFLAAGLALKQAAARLTISEHTARNQLKSALQKSGTTRQLELVRLVLLLQR